VRDDSSIKVTPDFTDNADGTVSEHNTDLTWQQDGTTSMTWEAALTQCESLTLADHEDWRLPNIRELRSISDDDNLWGPSVSTTYFTLTTTTPPITTAYWSSTTRENETTEAWFVDFYYGLSSHTAKTGTGYVLCVRSSGIFADDFESGDTSAWATTVP
ncbi:MAG: DUF1566 domain-containing protein, partial [bacterium]|nr:DUF1566 domain-containing protein [bacterium]